MLLVVVDLKVEVVETVVRILKIKMVVVVVE